MTINQQETKKHQKVRSITRTPQAICRSQRLREKKPLTFNP